MIVARKHKFYVTLFFTKPVKMYDNNLEKRVEPTKRGTIIIREIGT